MAEGTAKTIDQLPTKENILGTDFFPVDDGTQSYKATWDALLKLTGGIESVTAEGNTLIITTKGGQVYSFTPSDSTKQDKLTFDTTPTEGSGNPVTSGGVYDAVHEVSTALATEASTARAAEDANSRAIAVLNGNVSTEGSVEHTVEEYITNLIADAPESLDTLKEIADWIEGHAEDAAAMNSQISANTRAIAATMATANSANAKADEATATADQAMAGVQAVINQSMDLAFYIDEADGGLNVKILKEGY